MRILDGALGTELLRRGLTLPAAGWTAGAIEARRELLAGIHSDYAEAGATVHTACTFRTRPGDVGDRWATLAAQAVAICRDAVPLDHLVAGSVGPIADCYRPDLSPGPALEAHRALAEVLAAAGCGLLLCETFAHPDEALSAVRACTATGLPTWLALTAGPNADLIAPEALARTARAAVDIGASAVLVNCTPASRSLPFVTALSAAVRDVPVGCFANAGHRTEGVGWGTEGGPARYLAFARTWVDAGATLLGGCCGTGPGHIRALRDAYP